MLAATLAAVTASQEGLVLGRLLVPPLERRFPPAEIDKLKPIAGIIVLGGEVSRIEPAMQLALRFPGVPVLISGSEEIELALTYAGRMGVSRQRLILEPRSTSTYENALFAAELVRPNAHQCWLLVTSAFHMPRAIGVFRNVGFRVLPWPIFSTPETSDRLSLTRATYEWPRLIAYRLMGRTNAFLPGAASTGGDIAECFSKAGPVR